MLRFAVLWVPAGKRCPTFQLRRVIGMSLKLFRLGAENYTQKFRICLSVNDTVVITGCEERLLCRPKEPWRQTLLQS